MSTKREVSCGQIIAMLTLFILGSLASHMVLLSTVVVWFVYEKERDSTLTPKQRSILVFKDALEIELITMAIGIVLSLIVGYMYEIWSRKKVLTICFCLLAIGMIIPESKIIDDTDALYAAGRMITAAIAQCIMQNPLINDYVKKHNRGWASALNTIGKEIGEITAFILIYQGIHYDKENQQIIFYVMTGVVFVLGLLITCFLVKEKKVQRNYIVSDDNKKVVRHKDKIALDEDPNENSDEESYTHVIVPATYKFVRGVTLSCWDKTKLLFKQTTASIKGDLMTQFILYATFVN